MVEPDCVGIVVCARMLDIRGRGTSWWGLDFEWSGRHSTSTSLPRLCLHRSFAYLSNEHRLTSCSRLCLPIYAICRLPGIANAQFASFVYDDSLVLMAIMRDICKKAFLHHHAIGMCHERSASLLNRILYTAAVPSLRLVWFRGHLMRFKF